MLMQRPHTYQYRLDMGDKKRVSFQTSVDPTVEEEAMKTFLVFESGDSGDLSYNEFQQAVHDMGMGKDDKQVTVN